MTIKRYCILFIISLIGVTNIIANNVTFTIEAPNSTVKGAQIQVKYILRIVGNASEPQLPEISEEVNGFEVVYGPARSQKSTSMSYFNGQMNSETNLVYTYTMIASAEGTFTLPAATVNVGGRNYKSNTAQIKVLPPDKNAPAQQPGQRVQEITSSSTADNINPKDAFTRAIFSKTKVNEQEAVVVTFRFYTVLGVRDVGKVEFPEFEGFITEDFELNQNRQWKLEQYNGKNYRTIDIKKTLLFPQRSGKITIPSGKMDVIFAIKSGQVVMDFVFGPQEVMTEVKRTLKTTPETVDIASLPTGKPLSFSGGVGTFSFTPSISSTHVKANEAVTIKLDISGTGNLKLIKNPEIKFPSNLETYDPKINNNTNISENGLTGTKSIEYLFIPRYEGKYTIPSIEFSYFDTHTKKYKTVSSPEYMLTVDKDPNAGKGSSTSYMSQREIMAEQDIRHVKSGEYTFEDATDFNFGSFSYILWYLIPLLLFTVYSIAHRKQIEANANVALMRTKKANKVASKRLKMAKKHLLTHNKDKFYEEVLRAVWGYLSDKLTIPVAELNRENIETELKKYGVDSQLMNQYISILDTCEFARYAPSESSDAMDNVYNDTTDAIGKMENIIKK